MHNSNKSPDWYSLKNKIFLKNKAGVTKTEVNR